jgi:hypothetical protein
MKSCLPSLLVLLLITSCQKQGQEVYDPEQFINPELFKDHIRTTDFQTPEQENQSLCIRARHHQAYQYGI